MSTTKYLKFGARADKNLADLSDPTQALDNILDDISSRVSDDGTPLGFTSTDLSSIIGLRETSLADSVTESGQSTFLIDLAGNTIQSTSASGTLIDVAPRITINDYIRNYKTVLGDPPWINGGDGPNATFIPSDRLNANTTDNINTELKAHLITSGNRYRLEGTGTLVDETQMDAISVTNKGLAPAVGDIFVAIGSLPADMTAYNGMDVRNVTLPNGNSGTANANALTSNQLFTTKTDAALTSLAGPEDFWEDGFFNLGSRLHKSFINPFGGIQWTGYLDGHFSMRIESSGYYIIEEDIVDDGSENNWQFIKGVTSSDIKTFGNIKWTTVNDVTRVEFTNEDDYKRVVTQMEITLNSNQATVIRLYKVSQSYYADLDINVESEDTTGSIQTFEYDLFANANSSSGEINVTQPATGGRRRVRFSAWWPALALGLQYPEKTFGHVDPGSEQLNAYFFYKNDGTTNSYGQYTFPYFNTNRSNILKQESTSKLSVANTISIEYIPRQETSRVVPEYSAASNTVDIVAIKLTDKGVLESTSFGAGSFLNAEVGDWIVTVPAYTTNWANAASKAHAFQIEEKLTSSTVYVSKSYDQVTGLALQESHNIFVVKNTGLIGIYKKGSPIGAAVSFIKLDTGTGTMNKGANLVTVGDLVHAVTFTGGSSDAPSQDYALKVNNTVNSSDGDVACIISNHPKASGTSMVTGEGIALIYASRGLNDISAQLECGGAYGLEVTVASPIVAAPNQKIYVNDISRGSGMTADVVYFVGPNSAAPVIPQSTNNSQTGSSSVTAFGTDGTGKFITINTSLTAPLEPGTTIVLVPSTSSLRFQNREYCVIPLNTAPPFASTDKGLATKSTHKDLIVEDLIFSEIAINVNASRVISLAVRPFTNQSSVPDKNIPITYNGNTYKILINDNNLDT